MFPRAWMRLDLLVFALCAALGTSFAVARAAPATEPDAAEPGAAQAELPGLATDPVVGLRGASPAARLEIWGPLPFCDYPGHELSLLLDPDRVWLGSSTGWRLELESPGGEIDWAGLQAALVEVLAWPEMTGRNDIELAATDEVSYFALLEAMAVLHESGFTSVKFGEPHQLTSLLGAVHAAPGRR
jgi:hypothetical protein